MRTTLIGYATPPSGGVTPGMRRPVRMMTLPSMPSRSRRLGEPTSSLPSGVTVAALMPRPDRHIALAASSTTPLLVARRFSSERSKRSRSSGRPRTSGSRTRSAWSSSSWPVSSPSRTVMVSGSGMGVEATPSCAQGYLSGRERVLQLVRGRGRPRGWLPRGRAGRRARGDVLPPGAHRAVGHPGRALGGRASSPASIPTTVTGSGRCAHCTAPLDDTYVLLVRHRGEHRIADAFCNPDHLLDWAKAGGRWRGAA